MKYGKSFLMPTSFQLHCSITRRCELSWQYSLKIVAVLRSAYSFFSYSFCTFYLFFFFFSLFILLLLFHSLQRAWMVLSLFHFKYRKKMQLERPEFALVETEGTVKTDSRIPLLPVAIWKLRVYRKYFHQCSITLVRPPVE